MSSAVINLGSGTGTVSSTYSSSYVLSDNNGVDVITDYLTSDGTVSVAVPGASASATVKAGSAVSSAQSTISNGASVGLSMITSDVFLDVQDVDFVSVTLDVSALLDVSVDDQINEFAFGTVDNQLGLFYFDENGSQVLANGYLATYSLMWDTDVNGLESGSLKDGATLTVSYNFGSTYTGLLLIENMAQTFSEAQSHPANVPEPASLSLMVMGLAMLLPIALRRKVQ
jgi:hypothetical protein